MDKVEFEDFILTIMPQMAIMANEYRQNLEIITKSDGSKVTNADKDLEVFLKNEIIKRFPGFFFLGEEYGQMRGKIPFRFILDPIDGTTQYIQNEQGHSISLGLEDMNKKMIIFGAVCDLTKKTIYCNDRILDYNGNSKNTDRELNGIIHLQGSPRFKIMQRYKHHLGNINDKPYSTALRIAEAIAGNGIFLSDSNRIKSWDVAGGVGIANNYSDVLLNGLKDNPFNYLNPANSGIIIRRFNH